MPRPVSADTATPAPATRPAASALLRTVRIRSLGTPSSSKVSSATRSSSSRRGEAASTHVEHEVGLADLRQRRPERCDQRRRQFADESDRVDEDDVREARRRRARRARVERREETVGGEGRVARQAVEERRLARVRVARDRHLGVPPPAPSAHQARDLDLREVAAQPGDAVPDLAAVELELLLARAPAADAAAETREVPVGPRQPRQQVLELRQLDLRSRLARPGVQREDVEDQARAIEDADAIAPGLLEVADLARR